MGSAVNDSVWTDVTTTSGGAASSCTATTTNCSYKDKISGLEWSKQASASINWPEAVNHCDGLTHNLKTDWRLPTQKELMNGYEHGIRSVPATNFLTATYYFWSSSTGSTSTGSAWYVNLAGGNTNASTKDATSYRVVCVRP